MHAKENSHYQDQNTLRKTFGNISPVKGILFQMNEHSPNIKNQIPQYKPKLSGAFRSLISDDETWTANQRRNYFFRFLCKMGSTIIIPPFGILVGSQLCDLIPKEK